MPDLTVGATVIQLSNLNELDPIKSHSVKIQK